MKKAEVTVKMDAENFLLGKKVRVFCHLTDNNGVKYAKYATTTRERMEEALFPDDKVEVAFKGQGFTSYVKRREIVHAH